MDMGAADRADLARKRTMIQIMSDSWKQGHWVDVSILFHGLVKKYAVSN